MIKSGSRQYLIILIRLMVVEIFLHEAVVPMNRSLTCRAAFCWAAMCCCSALSLNSFMLGLDIEMLQDEKARGKKQKSITVNRILIDPF